MVARPRTGQYEASFRGNEIDADVLPELTDQHLKDLGVALGHRLKMRRAIRELCERWSRLSRPPSRAEAPDTAERRQLTVVFCDLVGSTALSARLDPEDMREIVGAYQRCCADLITKAGGFVAKYMGDGVLAYFGYPQAHEHDAERGVRAGLALVEAPRSSRPPPGFHCRFVSGSPPASSWSATCSDGEAQERGVVGETPNLAARLQAIAEPNMVVMAEGTRRLLGNLFELRDLGARTSRASPGRLGLGWRCARVPSRAALTPCTRPV